MEFMTRLLNVASLLMVVISGVYIQGSFSTILTLETSVLIWTTIAVYMMVLVEINFGVLKKLRLKL